jgi:1,4-alpha-glucan branching enzyme
MVTQQKNGHTEFAYFRPAATSVLLAGDFQGGRSMQHAMDRDDRGWWRARLDLNPGEYRFKYLIDGEVWEADFAAYGVESDRVGSWSSVIWIATDCMGNRELPLM